MKGGRLGLSVDRPVLFLLSDWSAAANVVEVRSWTQLDVFGGSDVVGELLEVLDCGLREGSGEEAPVDIGLDVFPR